MKWFIYLYPKKWRKRYGDELFELLNHTDCSIKVVIDLLLGIIDAWKIELHEKEILGFRMSQILLLVSLINIYIIYRWISLREVIFLEQAALIIAVLAFLLSVSVFIVSIFQEGIKNAFSANSKLAKISVGLFGVYALSFTAFLMLAN